MLAACAGAERGPIEIALADADTLVRSESELVATPADLAVDESGNVHVLGWRAGRIVVIEPATGATRFIGREGRGPGEFQGPLHLGLAGDTLRVTNSGNLRVDVFTTAGTFVRSHPMPLAAAVAPLTFAPDGRMAAASYGMNDSVLVRLYAQDGTDLGGVGELLAPATEAFHVTAIKADAEKGNVPEMFRNFAWPVFAADGGLWLVLTAEGVLRRYDVAGPMLWGVPIEAPELPLIKQAFFDRSRDLAGQPARFATLNYVQDALVEGDELWLLLKTPPGQPCVILVFGDGGVLRRRVVLPDVDEAGAFAVDVARRRLYVTPVGDASLLGFELPAR
ncbi:MAG: hypothetical protein ACREMJ_11865 [Gemmatimonadales bacterium]